MPNMVVTEPTFQFEILELKLDAKENINDMSVTYPTFQVPISPYCVRVLQLGVVEQFSLM